MAQLLPAPAFWFKRFSGRKSSPSCDLRLKRLSRRARGRREPRGERTCRPRSRGKNTLCGRAASLWDAKVIVLACMGLKLYGEPPLLLLVRHETRPLLLRVLARYKLTPTLYSLLALGRCSRVSLPVTSWRLRSIRFLSGKN